MTRERLWILGVLTALALTVTGVHWFRGTSTTTHYYVTDAAGEETPVSMKAVADWPAGKPAPRIHWAKTLGVWIGALCTLAILSFLYRDNPLYRVAEHVFVGISAAYWMTKAFWETVIPNLMGKLFPRAIKFSLEPGMELDEIVDKNATDSFFANAASAQGDGLTATWLQLMDPMYLIPAVLGVMLLLRLGPKRVQWMAIWPLAFIIGTTAGLRLIGFSGADFVKQIDATIQPIVKPVYVPAEAPDPTNPTRTAVKPDEFSFGKSFFASFSNIVLVLGTMCGLVYFFFSLEHRGAVGKLSRVGIWVLMITFGGGFGYTVMGRVTLLTARIEALVINWLNLIEP